MAIARLLYPSKGQMCLGADGWGVDVRYAVVELLQSPERDVDVPRVDR